MVDHRTNLKTFIKAEVILSIFFNYSGMKLEINKRYRIVKFTNMWKLSSTLSKKKLGQKTKEKSLDK